MRLTFKSDLQGTTNTAGYSCYNILIYMIKTFVGGGYPSNILKHKLKAAKT